jgi:hypothetical protein
MMWGAGRGAGAVSGNGPWGRTRRRERGRPEHGECEGGTHSDNSRERSKGNGCGNAAPRAGAGARKIRRAAGGRRGRTAPYAPRARGSGREAGSSTRRSWSASSRSSAPATEVPACTSTTARALSASTPGPCWQQAGEPCGFPPDAQRPRDPDGCMRAAAPATVAAHPRCARVPGGGARDGVARRARR